MPPSLALALMSQARGQLWLTARAPRGVSEGSERGSWAGGAGGAAWAAASWASALSSSPT